MILKNTSPVQSQLTSGASGSLATPGVKPADSMTSYETSKGLDGVGVFLRTSFFERFFEGVRTKRDRLTGAVSAGVAFRWWD